MRNEICQEYKISYKISFLFFIQRPYHPRRISDNHTICRELPTHYCSRADYAVISEDSAFEYDTIAAYEAIIANCDLLCRNKVAVASVRIVEKLDTLLCLNRVEIIIENLAVATNGGIIADCDALAGIDGCTGNADVVADVDVGFWVTGHDDGAAVESD